MTAPRPTNRLRVLVAIASFGEKNLAYLQRLIRRYQAMAMEVDIVVTSERPKSVDLGVEVIFGTPTRDPRSLPFAHTKLFAERLDRYDLFIYTEDDIDVSEATISAFIRASEILPQDEIAGFIRYEASPDGTRYFPDVHGRFRWRPGSVRSRHGEVFAEFTNEHAGFYIVTNDQLKRAIKSGNYLVAPYQGRYNMLESAATNIYVNCGFRKVICISQFDQFLLHHMPNNYIGKVGAVGSIVEEQLCTLLRIQRGEQFVAELCPVEPKVFESKWGKRYDDIVSRELLEAIPHGGSALTVGYGDGSLETELGRRGVRLTVFPLDSIVSAQASRRGLEVIDGTIEECLKAVRGRQFDCVIITNLIHLVSDPSQLLKQAAALVGGGGSLIVESPNFQHLPTLVLQAIGFRDYRKLREFSVSGLHTKTIGEIKQVIESSDLRVASQEWSDRGFPGPFARFASLVGRYGARAWVMKAVRDSSSRKRSQLAT